MESHTQSTQIDNSSIQTLTLLPCICSSQPDGNWTLTAHADCVVLSHMGKAAAVSSVTPSHTLLTETKHKTHTAYTWHIQYWIMPAQLGLCLLHVINKKTKQRTEIKIRDNIRQDILYYPIMLGLHDEQLVEQLGCPVGLINCSPKNCQKCRHTTEQFS